MIKRLDEPLFIVHDHVRVRRVDPAHLFPQLGYPALCCEKRGIIDENCGGGCHGSLPYRPEGHRQRRAGCRELKTRDETGALLSPKGILSATLPAWRSVPQVGSGIAIPPYSEAGSRSSKAFSAPESASPRTAARVNRQIV